MRIGILTATRTDNNGTDLQALAMLMMFNRLGATNVELIDYICEKLDSSKHLLSPLSLRKIAYYPLCKVLHHKHDRFREHNFVRSKCRFNKTNLRASNYDIIVAGSDQIWNLSITDGDLSFFLPFDKQGFKKYSYAASLGRTDLSAWENKFKISSLLSDFQGVSVREESAVSALFEIGIKARHDLDPILMSDATDWQKFIAPKQESEKYVLFYLLDSNCQAWEDAKLLAKKNGWRVINVSPALKIYRDIKTIRCAGIEEWLYYVANAEMIYTSSYHCLSFAILFNKPFCLVPLENAVQSNERMLDLVNRLGLSSRVYSPNSECSETIEWDVVNKTIKTFRLSSEKYVKKIIAQ